MGLLLGLLLGLGLFLVVTSGEDERPRDQQGMGWRGRTARLLAESGVRGVSPVQLVLLSVGLGLFVAVIVLVLSSTVTLALAFGAFAVTVPRSLLVRRREARIRERRELWPEVVDHLASAVRAGLSLPEGVSGLGTRGPAPLRPSFERFAEDYRAYGAFGPCLDRLADQLADPAADRIVEALRLAREVGGSDLGPAAAHAVLLPARRPAHPRRARGAAGLDGQRSQAGTGRAVDRPAAAGHAHQHGAGV